MLMFAFMGAVNTRVIPISEGSVRGAHKGDAVLVVDRPPSKPGDPVYIDDQHAFMPYAPIPAKLYEEAAVAFTSPVLARTPGGASYELMNSVPPSQAHAVWGKLPSWAWIFYRNAPLIGILFSFLGALAFLWDRYDLGR